MRCACGVVRACGEEITLECLEHVEGGGAGSMRKGQMVSELL